MGAAGYPSVEPCIVMLQMIAKLTVFEEMVIRQTENISQFYTATFNFLPFNLFSLPRRPQQPRNIAHVCENTMGYTEEFFSILSP